MSVAKQFTNTHPPTQAQLDYLFALGYDGEDPETRGEASYLITLLRKQGALLQHPLDRELDAILGRR